MNNMMRLTYMDLLQPTSALVRDAEQGEIARITEMPAEADRSLALFDCVACVNRQDYEKTCEYMKLAFRNLNKPRIKE